METVGETGVFGAFGMSSAYSQAPLSAIGVAKRIGARRRRRRPCKILADRVKSLDERIPLSWLAQIVLLH